MAKVVLVLYPPLENSTTHIAIMCSILSALPFNVTFFLYSSQKETTYLEAYYKDLTYYRQCTDDSQGIFFATINGVKSRSSFWSDFDQRAHPTLKHPGNRRTGNEHMIIVQVLLIKYLHVNKYLLNNLELLIRYVST